MDTFKFEAFVCTAEKGSFTAAADFLGYTQPGISKLINALEEEFGFPLFIRKKKGVVLSQNGAAMLPVIKELIMAKRNIEQLAADIRGTVTGSLTIGSYYSISAMWLPEVISRFHDLFPGIIIRLEEGGNREMSKWLTEKSVDCCFCAFPQNISCKWTPVMKDEIVAWIPKNHPLADIKTIPVEILEAESFIHTQPGQDTELDRLIADLNIVPNTKYTTRDAFTTYNMVAAGLGISFNQKLISTRWNANVIEKSFDPPQYISLGIAVPDGMKASPAAQRFINFISEPET